MKYFEGVVPFFAMIVIQTFIVYSLNIYYTAYTQAISEEVSQNIIYLISILGVFASGIVFFFWYRQEIRREVRGNLRDLFAWKNIILFVFLGIGCQYFFSGFMSLIQPLFVKIFDDYSQQVDRLTSGNGILVLLLAIIVAPIAEELVFRGVILHKTLRVMPFLGANLLQALLFGIYHWNFVQGVYAALIGFLLGLIYYKFKTIVAPIILHMLINASAFLAMLFPNTTSSYLIMTVVGGIFIFITILLIKPYTATRLK
jgi:membrane protease YdiL (CAAX protease family)